MLSLLLLLSCSDAPVEHSPIVFRTGQVRFGEEMRTGIAYAPGDWVSGSGAFASSCPGTIGDFEVNDTWRDTSGPVEGTFVSSCKQPLWLHPPALRSESQRDSLLIILDSFRADHMRPELTPRIWAHAQESWWPTSAWTPSSWTVPSVSALFTGRPPWAITHPEDHRLPDEQRTLAEMLPELERWMISANAFVSASNGFGQGFQRFSRLDDDDDVLATAQRWWATPKNRGRLLVVQLMSTHLPYEPSTPPPGSSPNVGDQFWDLDNWASFTDEDDQKRIAQLYAGTAADVDRVVGALLDLVGPQAITAIVSDHGEELFDHGGFEHGHAFWEEVTRVHAAIRVPGEPPSRPAGHWSLQAIGQRFALALGVPQQETWFPTSQDAIVHGYPLQQRDTVLHEWGARRGDDIRFIGPKPFSTPEGLSLQPLVDAAQASERIAKAEGKRWCEMTIQEGVPFTLPVHAEWQPDQPPASWGPLKSHENGRQIFPSRSGTWRISGVKGNNCETLTELHPWEFTELETAALRALGYLDLENDPSALKSDAIDVD